MPRNRRAYLLRFEEAANNDYDRALRNLMSIKEAYKERHPEHAEAIALIMELTMQVQMLLRDFRLKHM